MDENGKVTVIITDDHELMRVGIRQVLSSEPKIEVIGETDDGKPAVGLVSELKPKVLILDLQMKVMDGFEAAKIFHASHSPVKILILSAYNDPHFKKELRDLGVKGYLTKEEAPELLIDAVLTIAAGGTYFR